MPDQSVTITPETLLDAATAAYAKEVGDEHDVAVDLLNTMLIEYFGEGLNATEEWFDLPSVPGEVATITYRLRVLDTNYQYYLSLSCYYADPDSAGTEYYAEDETGEKLRIDSLASLGRAMQVLRHPKRRYVPTHREQLLKALSAIITDMLDEAGVFNHD